jgi:4-diphosphocytidyl-2-C-methyl-D-erythritol kinase
MHLPFAFQPTRNPLRLKNCESPDRSARKRNETVALRSGRRDSDRFVQIITVKAFAKINLTLRVLGTGRGGYHDLRTVLQSVALHDTLTFRTESGAGFRIECNEPECPTDSTNLVWRAADHVWRALERRGRPRDTVVRIAKRIPLRSGLGGGSSDAAAAIRGLAALWNADLPRERQQAIAAGLGADVAFFLDGGTSLGVERGDLLFPMIDLPVTWVTLVIPQFGVSTKDAYEWFDRMARARAFKGGERSESLPKRERGSRVERAGPDGWPLVGAESRLPAVELRNDLQEAVATRHPEITRVVRELRRLGARHAAMSGSGSAVFGLFDSRKDAEAASGSISRRTGRSVVTRTIRRASYRASSRPRSFGTR